MEYKNMTNKKMEIWNKLEKTNPKHTKQARSDYGKMITTIDAMHQIKNMTEYFGPVGKGWSYAVNYHYTDKLVFAEVKIQYCLEGKWYEYGPVCSLSPIGHVRGSKKGQLDDEAPKKAMTDALTKAFSHLGLNADVFLGKFDNNKYVQEITKEFNNKNVIDDFEEENSVGLTTGSALNNNVANIRSKNG